MEGLLYLNFGEEKKSVRYTVAEIKNLGLMRSDENLKTLLKLYDEVTDIEIKHEIVSSIGRKTDDNITKNLPTTEILSPQIAGTLRPRRDGRRSSVSKTKIIVT